MKNKLKISCCLAVSILFTLYVPHTNTMSALQEQESSWSKMSSYVSAFFYGKKTNAKKSKPKKNVIICAEQPASINTLSRPEALEGIKKITTRLFDSRDVNHISLHLNQMKEFIKFLDEIEDKKLIAAIHFLLENHHKSSMTYLAFWIQSVQKYELDTIIPMTKDVANMPKAEKLAILRRKMTIGN